MDMEKKFAYVVGTYNTKGAELNYLAERIKDCGIAVRKVDLSTGEQASSHSIDISAAAIAAAHPQGASAVLGKKDRGEAVAAMSEAFVHFIGNCTDLAGIIGAGGSGGTALIAPALRALPVGRPKMLVSTMASGNVAPYVGASDITMMYSVTDVEGLNPISRQVLGNAAHALAGMIAHASSIDTTSSKPALGLTMFGVTTPCIKLLTTQLQSSYECLVFHATGTGGRSMEKLADSSMLAGVLDITTTEIADMLVGGVLAATEERMDAIIRQKIPYIGSVGALDMVNFGAPSSIPEQFNQRLFHQHNPEVTLMRTTVDENIRIGEWIANKLNQMQGRVRFLLPLGGVSMLDAEGQSFFDPEADAALFDTIESKLEQTADRQLIRVATHINDQAFTDSVLVQFNQIMT